MTPHFAHQRTQFLTLHAPKPVVTSKRLRYYITAMALNARQELFVQNLVAEGMNATAAYRAAGYKGRGNTAEVGASEILRNPKVIKRVADVQAEHAKRTAITVDDLVAKLQLLYSIAVEDRQTGPGVQAIMGIGKLLGLIVDRQELRAEVVRKPVADPDAPSEMSTDDWAKKYGGKIIEHQP